MARGKFLIVGLALLPMLHPALAQDARPAPDDAAIQTMQKQFAEAYNRKDADAMANFFSEKGFRITPTGIFQGRDAIRRDLQNALSLGLHDYSVRRTISRKEGSLVFDVGEWQAKLGDRPFHGYYSALVVDEGGQVKILEETVNGAPALGRTVGRSGGSVSDRLAIFLDESADRRGEQVEHGFRRTAQPGSLRRLDDGTVNQDGMCHHEIE